MIKNYLLLILLSLHLTISLFAQPQWRLLPNSPQQNRAQDIFFINANTGWCVNFEGEIHSTTNGGALWIRQLYLPNVRFRSLAFINPTTGYAGTLDTNLLFKTTNAGLNWTRIGNIINPRPSGLCGMSVVNQNIIYGCGVYWGDAKVVKTTNGGLNWSVINLSSQVYSLIDCHFFNPDTGFVAGGVGNTFQNRMARILYTTNGGASWSIVHTASRTNEWCWKISFPTRQIGFVSIERESGASFFLKTTNGGINWTEFPVLPNVFVYQQGIGFVNETTGWVGGGNFTYQTSNGGLNWTNNTFGELINRFRFLSDTLGYAGGRGVFKYSITPIGIIKISEKIPSQFLLEQNYPNPFNPKTIISFQLAVNSFATLKVYDLLGREVAVLVNENLNAGTYEVDFDGSNLGSGVYYYKLSAGDFTETRKMVLIK